MPGPAAAQLAGPLIDPVVAVVSFVCSIGNVPLAVVLWKGGISFGGVVAFIFAGLQCEDRDVASGAGPVAGVGRVERAGYRPPLLLLRPGQLAR